MATEIAKKIQKYRELTAEECRLKTEIEDKIINYIYSFFKQPISILVFLNLGGKYIVVENYSQQFFTKELIDSVCEYFKIDYEGCTVENSIDYEGNELINKIIYCFEVRYR